MFDDLDDLEIQLILVSLEGSVANWAACVEEKQYPRGFNEESAIETLKMLTNLADKLALRYHRRIVDDTAAFEKEIFGDLDLDDLITQVFPSSFGPQGGQNDDDDWN